jgi:superfamily II DNA or RNA helicase
VVAATGTGKTMIAAFDYSRFARKLPTRPTLLFIAHREEILQQAMGAFRAVLRDNNFGDLLTGGQNPNQEEHLFCTIQSYQSRELYAKDERFYDYVIVDEFHHAAAPSYQRLLKHVKPQVLLGLTATPERTDQLDILSWFGGQASAEIRLPDAINRRLLCPFQYFGVTDSVDLDNLTWQRGGYRRDELDEIYTGNDIRAGGIVAKVQEILLNPALARGLGFCVSIAHAEFMAHFFNNHGLAAACLTGNSPDEERRSVQARLSRRSINFLFVVDLYNEGVDLPEIDTVLFLRPTESLTIFLQQMGRGLRLHPQKDCLTILDFIGAQRREYRFSERFRALSSNPAKRLDKEIEHGFPNLPSGCSIRLERVAQKYILENIRNSIRKSRLKLVADIKELGRYYGRTPTISEVLEYLDMSLDALLKRYLWSDLLADAGLIDPVNDSDQDRLTKGLHRISHIDDFERIRYLLDYMRGDGVNNIDSAKESPFLVMLQVALWGKSGIDWSLAESENRLRLNRSAWSDLQVILQYKLSMAPVLEYGQLPSVSGPLTIHAHYTRDEILVALGHWSLDRRPEHREGVLHIKHSRVDAFFVTLQKTEADYSPTTMYEDYLVSHNLFHWQSQSNTSAESNTGQRYIHHEAMGYTPLMFVREHNDLPSGLSAPYAYLGPCQYVSHQGSRPMSIIWKLRHPVPARLFRVMARQIIA